MVVIVVTFVELILLIICRVRRGKITSTSILHDLTIIRFAEQQVTYFHFINYEWRQSNAWIYRLRYIRYIYVVTYMYVSCLTVWAKYVSSSLEIQTPAKIWFENSGRNCHKWLHSLPNHVVCLFSYIRQAIEFPELLLVK